MYDWISEVPKIKACVQPPQKHSTVSTYTCRPRPCKDHHMTRVCTLAITAVEGVMDIRIIHQLKLLVMLRVMLMYIQEDSENIKFKFGSV